ncbi:MAG: helix-turn-helix domain-containing protein [Prevotellaceae bacterium]|jgi:signal transduction histidine kinase/DNA-binding response OmpR family regulator/ligand-binding sensor domain-containing protein|nr:helix-turn-helix domain-containing protein [Prevotellaceae bacterium]
MLVKLTKYLLTVFAACIFARLHADEMTIRQIPVAEDLPSSTVYRMFQDRDGFVWFGTTNGFCRYDGYNMKSFRSEIARPSFPSNYITGGFAEDTLNGVIWTGTERGVLMIDKGADKITLLDSALLGNALIRQILCAGDAMWICADDGLYLYSLDGSLRKKYRDGASSIHIDSRGTVRITAWMDGIYYLDRDSDAFVRCPPIGNGNNPHKIFQDREGHFWVCTWGDGLYRFYPDRRGQNMYERMDVSGAGELSHDIFFGIEQDEVNGYLWALSYAGLIVFKPEGRRIVPINELARPINNLTNIFSDIIRDRDGNLWIGTYEQGAIVVNPVHSPVTGYDLQCIKKQTGHVSDISEIFEDRDGELWLRQRRLGLFLFDTKTAAVRRLNIPEIDAANAMCCHSATGEIWLAIDYVPHIHRLRKSGGKVTLVGTIDMSDILSVNMPAVRFLHEDGNGVIWAATNDAILSYRDGEWTLVNGDCGTVTGMTEDVCGNIWLGTAERGLWQIASADGSKKTVMKNYNKKTSGIAGNNISGIAASADGQLWFGVNEKQLYSYDINRQQFADCTQKANVNNFVIFGIVAGSNGRIWISSNKQLVEFNPSTGASVQYDAWNDLILTSLYGSAMIETRNGAIVLGGNKGLCIFTPSPQLDLPCRKVRTAITGIKINGTPVCQSSKSRENPEWQKKLVLMPEETHLEINFSSFNYLNPGKTRYACKLEGVDKQWIYAEPGRNFAIYNHLRKGEYTFLVKSTGDNQLWSDEITSLHIIKKPTFYETGWAYFGYTVIILLILFAGLRFYANRIELRNELRAVQRDREKSEELIQTKLRFFTNIGHEFRTPLTLIMTPLNTLISQLTDGNMKQKLSSIYRNAEDMLGLINQLLDFRKIETGGEKLQLSCDDFVKFVEYIYSAFRDVAANKAIHFTFDSELQQLFMAFDKSKIRKVINNIYSNALKFTPDEGYIATSLRLAHDGGREFVCIDIADSGCGVAESEQQTIFERFYQSKNNDPDKTGSGIGLHIVKEYLKLHGGQITLNSRVGKGSVFSVSIPVDLQSADDTVHDNAMNTADAPDAPDAGNNEHKTLLIVEDNIELRNFLAEQLGDKFTVLHSSNGKEGADIARKKLPDLIVSDVMMPVMNGLEMCRELKSSIETSHIPIILLTARLSDESKIESYKAGADSYIPKPFNFEVLLTRIEMLIEQQEKRRKLFHKTIEITPSSITTTSLDEELIRKALLLVEKNMDNSDYSVDELAADLALSRRHLSRKFQSIIGLSPGEFIRSVRLKRAAQMLKNTQYNISEISDRVGFSAIKSFNQNFKEEFGVTPTQYRVSSE